MPQSLPATATPAIHLPDLAELLPWWQRALRAERKAPGTIATYTAGVRTYLRWCENAGASVELTKATVQDFVADLLDGGAEGTTAHSRLKGVRRFSAWLTEERILVTEPLLGMRSPKLDRKVVQALDEDQLKALIKACAGQWLGDRRDEAIVRRAERRADVAGLRGSSPCVTGC